MFNYENIDEFIKKRQIYLRENIIDYYHFSYKNSLKNSNCNRYTIENCILGLEEDKVVKRYKKWKDLIGNYLNNIDNRDNYINYWIIQYVFFQKKKFNYIKEYLNIDLNELNERKKIIIYQIYKIAIKEKLYRKEKENGM